MINFEIIKKFWKPIAVLVLMLVSLYGGWHANEIYHGYKDNQEAKIEKLFDAGIQRMQQQGAQNLIDTQNILKAKKDKVITVEIPKIVEKEVYKNPALDQDGVDALRKLKEINNEKRTN